MLDRTYVQDRNPAINISKLEQVILSFLHRSNNEHLGKVKLMKLLYYTDFDHYEQYDQPVTGASYRKMEHGPVPDDVDIVLDCLAREGAIRSEQVPAHTYMRTKYTPLMDPDLSLLSPEEKQTLEQVANRWKDFSMTQIVEATHGEAPWMAVRMGEEIPYHLSHYRNNFGEMNSELDHGGELPSEEQVFGDRHVAAI
jgi:uncharacterized phage-associated protein